MPLDSGKKIRKRKAQTSEGETRATLDVKKSLETEQGLQIEHQSATWSAPLPPPAALAQYEEILPGSAQKIFVSFEERGNTRQQLEINESSKMQEAFVSGQKMQIRACKNPRSFTILLLVGTKIAVFCTRSQVVQNSHLCVLRQV